MKRFTLGKEKAIVEFVAEHLAAETNSARDMQSMFAKDSPVSDALDFDPASLRASQKEVVVACEAMETLLNDTIRPHLKTTGATGDLARHQLRLLAARYTNRAGYQEGWTP
jgi:hypothetical protein